MTTALFADEIFAAHETPDGHPERAARYGAVMTALGDADFTGLARQAPRAAPAAAIDRVHPGLLDSLSAMRPETGLAALDPDTFIGARSIESACMAAGAAIAAVDLVMAGAARNAFVVARPPGHHALPDRAMGFCLFNTAAIAARHARAAHGAQRLAIVDFDVHHGNGTQAAFWNDPDGFFASSHEFPQYPGTGRASERGAFDTIFNAPLPTGSDGAAFRRAWGERLLPALADFKPDFVVISAGFDAHRADPLGGLMLTEADFEWVTAEIAAIAAGACAGRLISVLEGGYDLAALGRSAAAHVRALMAA